MVSIASSQEDAWESNFDIESTRKVNELFNSLEEFLYSEVSKACLQSQECLEWSRVFPYLRFFVEAKSEIEFEAARQYPHQNTTDFKALV